MKGGLMASNYSFLLSDSIESARPRIVSALAANGFASEPLSNGGLVATRGSARRTLLLGGLAGKHLHMRFEVQFLTDTRPEGDRVVARISRNLTAGALAGGVIGATRTASVFDELAGRIRDNLAHAGVLIETRSG